MKKKRTFLCYTFIEHAFFFVEPGQKIPPWSKQAPVESAAIPSSTVAAPSSPSVSSTPTTGKQLAEEKNTEKSAMAVETWPPSLK